MRAYFLIFAIILLYPVTAQAKDTTASGKDIILRQFYAGSGLIFPFGGMPGYSYSVNATFGNQYHFVAWFSGVGLNTLNYDPPTDCETAECPPTRDCYNTSILVGKAFKLNPVLRLNLSAGPSFGTSTEPYNIEYYYDRGGLFFGSSYKYRYEENTYRTYGMAGKAGIHFMATRFVALELGAMGILQTRASYGGIYFATTLGYLRGKMPSRIKISRDDVIGKGF